MNEEEKRRIDRRRDAAVSMSIGSMEDDGKIVAMFAIDSRLHTIMENAIYAIHLADEVDPERTNQTIPNNQQRVLAIGANDPIVGSLILTAKELFKSDRLSVDLDEKVALSLAWRLTKYVAAMAMSQHELTLLQDNATEAYEQSKRISNSLKLPSIEQLESHFDAFAQKLGHAVDVLKEISRLFYPDLPKKWIDALTRRTANQLGLDHPFSRFAIEAGSTLLFMRGFRNMIEHPRADRRVKVFDFRQLPTGDILPPSVEIVGPGEDAEPISATYLMSQLIDSMVAISESLFAHLCGATVQPFGGLEIGVAALPEEQRSLNTVRLSYVAHMNGEWMRFG